MADSPEQLEQQLVSMSFTSVEELEGIVSIARSAGGWTVTEYDTDDSDDRYLTGDVLTTEVSGPLAPALVNLWPDMIGGVRLEGLTSGDAARYLEAAEVASFLEGTGLNINGVWAEAVDGHFELDDEV